MPELPEAEITAKKLKPLVGKRIAGFWSDWPGALRVTTSAVKINKDIKGRKILKIVRKGKVIFLHFSGGRILAFHMRMSGSLKLKMKNEKLKMDEKHTHIKIFFKSEKGLELGLEDPRKFGVVWYGKEEEVKKEKYLSSLGPDALSVSFDEFLKRMGGRKGRVKPLLLRQDVICGIGNIIADESLWQAKIHPLEKAENIEKSQWRKLFNAIKKVLQRGIKAKGTTLRNWTHPDGQTGRFQNYMKIYGRAGKKCPRCKNIIQRMVVAGRGTYFCPFCQKLS